MLKREESSWSLFQCILLAFSGLMLLCGVPIVITNHKDSDYIYIFGFILIGTGVTLLICWYLLHQSAKRSMIEWLNMVEMKYLERLKNRAARGGQLTIIFTVLTVIGGIYLAITHFSSEEGVIDKLIVLFLFPILAALFGFALFYWIFFHTPYMRFSKYYKERYVLEVLRSDRSFTNLTYEVKAGFDMEEVTGMNLFLMGDKTFYLSEDILRGYYKGRAFSFGDVKTGRSTQAGELRYKENLFYGQVVVLYRLEDQKESDGLLLVRDHLLLGPNGGSIERVQTESVAFHDKFDVFAEKPLNAFYILTPPFMEKIMELSERIEGELSLCFYKHTVYAAVNSKKDVFDPDVDIDLNEKKDSILNEDVSFIRELVDVLIMPEETKENGVI